jgi:hypothetical protein
VDQQHVETSATRLVGAQHQYSLGGRVDGHVEGVKSVWRHLCTLTWKISYSTTDKGSSTSSFSIGTHIIGTNTSFSTSTRIGTKTSLSSPSSYSVLATSITTSADTFTNTL